MLKSVFKFLVCYLLLFTQAKVYAQVEKTKLTASVKTDSSKVTPSSFDKRAIETYSEQKEFQYDESKTRDLSLWDRFWMWFWEMISRLITTAGSTPGSKYFFIFVGIAIMVYIIIKIIGSENIFSKKSKETILQYDVLNDNIHEIDYEKELQKLIGQGKYRLAVRLLYLRSLKKLSDANIIDWKPDKTNYNYLTEISKPELQSAFGKLTHQFDYIWYGDFPVDENKFEPINHSFNQFNAAIK
ncbi:DUF4129 domain-containing protein [Pedobacter aquatilis]|uniref:DUF4129 domain-containing protein n=1 Tax=Pedobacter aquatilis TaxID=351343 RepID=UPI0025B2DC23|nr:DUF4129 domain-containing protein [Pedobacter aquatilis]MDN3587388.1 DUF4129 domain-containing protein [Pedobacter aquatilis]